MRILILLSALSLSACTVQVAGDPNLKAQLADLTTRVGKLETLPERAAGSFAIVDKQIAELRATKADKPKEEPKKP